MQKHRNFKANRRPNWREYQAELQRPRFQGFNRRRAMVLLAALTLFCIVYIGVTAWQAPSAYQNTAAYAPSSFSNDLISKKDVQLLIEHSNLTDLMAKQVALPFKEHRFHVQTSLDENLQSYLTQEMDRENSRFIGIVVMAADTGRVLALAGFDKTNPGGNPCLSSNFPAASIFKMVTAAAAVDHCDYNANTALRFNGSKHTLYKSQLKEFTNRYTHTLSFKDSFAQSVNPVFGKLGALKLGKNVLEQYASAFGFNQPIDFELPIAPSHIHIDETPYHWAEIASGFNLDTKVSPLHAAMMASAVLNDGRMVAPTLVERITDENGRLLYRSQTAWGGRAMSSKASAVLERLMETTVQAGTGRKAFRGYQRHQVLSKLRIGGKTGSISNRVHDARFDWFVGFAHEKDGHVRLAVAALVAHEEFIGIRAAEYARMAMTHYFRNQLAQRANSTGSPSS